MGKMICQTHGPVDLVHVCSHVEQRVSAGEPPGGRSLVLLASFHVCDKCFEALGFQKFVSSIGGSQGGAAESDAFEAVAHAIGSERLLCPKCIVEAGA